MFHTENLAEGGRLALAGMTIVFVALTLISAFIAALPRMMGAASKFLPEERDRDVRPRRDQELDAQLVAAIGYALHLRGEGNPASQAAASEK